MAKTILIGINNKFSANAHKVNYILTGILYFILGITFIIKDGIGFWGYTPGILISIAGTLYALYGAMEFSENSKFASKVKVDDAEIVLKNSFWKPAHKIKWTDIVAINFEPYQIVFLLQNSTYEFAYKCDADISREAKRTIREIAEQKDIEITGG